MRTSLLILFLALFCGLSWPPAFAGDLERYQAVLVQSGDVDVSHPQVLIVDTKEGHLWLWERESDREKEGALSPGNRLSYQGRVGPGDQMVLPPSGSGGKTGNH